MAYSQQRFFVISLLCMTIVLSSGCQLTSNNVNSRLTYGEYYLALQQLSPQQLLEEVIKQQTQVEQISNESPNYNAQIKLLLLYSSPKLNQRLLMRNRLIAEQKLQQENFQKTGTMQQQNAIKIQQNLIEQVKLLEQTIKQLKDIEQAIDKRDQ
jgi:hypothetical protein